MTKYDYIKSLIVTKKAKKNGKNRFRAAMIFGGTLVAIVLVLNGWTVLDSDSVNPLLNNAFSILMVLSGGIAIYTIDQTVLGLQISDLERRLLHSLEDFHKENRRKEKAYLRKNRGKVVKTKPALRSGYELCDIGGMAQARSFGCEQLTGYARRE